MHLWSGLLILITYFSVILCSQAEELGVGCGGGHQCNRNGFKDLNGLNSFLTEMNEKYPHLTRVFSIGRSTKGNDMNVIEISDKPGNNSEFEANIKFVANMHGVNFLTYFFL
jgi:hypothetical protein